MAWKMRHQGSPQSSEPLTFEQVLEGLVDGVWEPTDEVMGPGETTWTSLENHPQFAEIAADIEPPPPKVYDDDAKVDMNALIDVTLVLLIFFILTTSYAAIQKRLDTPDLQSGEAGKGKVVSPEDVKEQMILVTVRLEGGKPVIRVEDEVVEPGRPLEAKLDGYRKRTNKTIILLQAERNVPTGAVIAVQDAARGAGISKISRLLGRAGG